MTHAAFKVLDAHAFIWFRNGIANVQHAAALRALARVAALWSSLLVKAFHR
jgi:hypothetical protein